MCNTLWQSSSKEYVIKARKIGKKAIYYLKKGCIKIRQGHIEQIILYHVDNGWDWYFQKVDGLHQNILQHIPAQTSKMVNKSTINIYALAANRTLNNAQFGL